MNAVSRMKHLICEMELSAESHICNFATSLFDRTPMESEIIQIAVLKLIDCKNTTEIRGKLNGCI